jgi:hypothetical protein
MLDLNHPDTQNIFTASGYLTRINLSCRKYIKENYEERQLTFLEMKSECDALNDFSAIHFAGTKTVIVELTEKIKGEIDQLEKINLTTDEGCCSVCNTPLNTIDTFIKDKQLRYMTICQECPIAIYGLLNELEVPTGVMWI